MRKIIWVCFLLSITMGLIACGSTPSTTDAVENLGTSDTTENEDEIEDEEEEESGLTPEQQTARDEFYQENRSIIEKGINKVYLNSDSPSSILLSDIYVEVEIEIDDGSKGVTVYYIYKSANDSGTDLVKHYDEYESYETISFFEHDNHKEMFINHINNIDEYFTIIEDTFEPFEETILGYTFKGTYEYTVFAPNYLRRHTVPENVTTVETDYTYYKLSDEQVEEMQTLIEQLNE